MNYGYYPGCSQTHSAKEFDISLKKVVDKLGITLEEIYDWSCCGATSAHATSHRLASALALRNIVLAGSQGLKNMVAPCAACYNRLLTSQNEISKHPSLKEDAEELLSLKIPNDVCVMNILQFFLKIGLSKISELKVRDLSYIKAACYYGCLLVRPYEITKFEDPEHPESMEKILEAAGVSSVEWNFRTECCGAAHSIARKDIVVDLSKKIIDDAILNGANVIVVACPMCHTNLDMRQKAMKRIYEDYTEIPVLYITELIGLALGMDEKELGINLHYIKFRHDKIITEQTTA